MRQYTLCCFRWCHTSLRSMSVPALLPGSTITHRNSGRLLQGYEQDSLPDQRAKRHTAAGLLPHADTYLPQCECFYSLYHQILHCLHLEGTSSFDFFFYMFGVCFRFLQEACPELWTVHPFCWISSSILPSLWTIPFLPHASISLHWLMVSGILDCSLRHYYSLLSHFAVCIIISPYDIFTNIIRACSHQPAC